MASRDFRHGLDDMLDSIVGIEHAIECKTFADYEKEWVLRHALQRGIDHFGSKPCAAGKCEGRKAGASLGKNPRDRQRPSS